MARCGMYSKSMLVFEIVKAYGIIYEFVKTAQQNGKPAELLGDAMERFNLIAGYPDSNDYGPVDDPVNAAIEACPDSANKMAIDFLEWVFSGAPQPEWAKVE